MIPVIRVDLDDNFAKRLDHRTAALKKSNADSATARAAWNSAPTEKVGIRSHLARMAPGIQRCMYCGDNLGTDIDHFEPIKESPARTFEWLNHLLACSHCNSNQKRDLFPRDAAGNTLLIDPAREDPGQHLRLILRTGKYRALTLQGEESIRVFGLNRDDLARGRAGAFATRGAVLCHAHTLLSKERYDGAVRCLRALIEEPHASVLHEMLRTVQMPGAGDVLGGDVVAALTDPELLAILRPVKTGRTTDTSGTTRPQSPEQADRAGHPPSGENKATRESSATT